MDRFDYQPDDARLYEMALRLARYALIEEQRRAGAYAVVVGAYSLLREPSDSWPPRLPIVDRRTAH